MSPATAGDMIQDAMELLGVYAPGETMTDADAERGLSVLNDMLDSWSNESLSCYAILEQSAPLVPMKNSYTIGPGGNFNMTRPLRIIDGPGAAYVQDFNGNNYQMDVVPRDKWNLYGNRSNLVTSDFPDVLFYDPQFPLGVINVMPFPTISYTMFWDSYLQISEFATLTTELSLPPGYKRAIVTNLAVCAKPYWVTAQLDPLIMLEAKDRLGSIKRTNMRSAEARMDPEMVSRGSVGYNIYTDSAGRNSSS